MVRQMLHEHAASLSAASHPKRSRRLIKCAKESGHYSEDVGDMVCTLSSSARMEWLRRYSAAVSAPAGAFGLALFRMNGVSTVRLERS
jgi:hypothetical protein